MSIPKWKPYFATTRVLSQFKIFSEQVLLSKFKIFGKNYSIIMTRDRDLRYFYLTTFFKRLQYRNLFWASPLVPYSRDTIWRAYGFIQTWQSQSYRRMLSRKKRDSRTKPKYFKTAREMFGMKYGEFLRTRRHMPFRSKVDSKKISKLQRDVEKANRLRRHWEKENTRLLIKAQLATKSKGAKKQNIQSKDTKNIKKG